MAEPYLIGSAWSVDSRGGLLSVEFEALPFQPVRVFTVSQVPTGQVRGGHAHILCSQILFCVQGEIEVNTYGASGPGRFTLAPHGRGLVVPRLNWASQTYLTPDTCLLVLASHRFDPHDYIQDRWHLAATGREMPSQASPDGVTE